MGTKCPNCNHVIESKYCAECGTLRTGRRLTFNDIITTAADSVLNLDNSLLRTFVQLYKDPYVVVQQYWRGYKRYYMDPFRFFLVSLVFVGFKIYLGGENIFFFSIGADETNIGQEWIALCSRIIVFNFLSMIVFSKLNASFLEHLVATIYIISFVSILELPISLFIKYIGVTWIGSVIAMGFTIYIFYSFSRAYISSTETKEVKKGLLAYIGILFCILSILAMTVFLIKIAS